LRPYVRIDPATQEFIPTSDWTRLGQVHRIIAYLLARKAMVALEIPLDKEAVPPRGIEGAIGMKGGTLRSLLRRLLQEGLVARDRAGDYCIPNYALEAAKARLAAK
jgi:hypothetical protein